MKPRGRKRKLAAFAMLSLRLLFGGPQLASSNSNTFQSGGNSETEISRVSEQNSPSMSDLNQAQPEQVRKGTQGSQIALKIPSGVIRVDQANSDLSQNQKVLLKEILLDGKQVINQLRVKLFLLKPSLQRLSMDHGPRHCREILIFLKHLQVDTRQNLTRINLTQISTRLDVRKKFL